MTTIEWPACCNHTAAYSPRVPLICTKLVQHDILTDPGATCKTAPTQDGQQQTACGRPAGPAEPGEWCGTTKQLGHTYSHVRKKDQSPRLCVDCRPLNEWTIKDAYPLPRIQDTLDTLSAKYFSTLDLTSCYWQVEMTLRARKAAAFCTWKGLFEWNVMLFGLCNAPASFQRLMDRVLAGLQWETCLVYLDDMPSKCCLFLEQVAYLGHIVSARGVATDPQKIQKVVERPTPRNISDSFSWLPITHVSCRISPHLPSHSMSSPENMHTSTGQMNARRRLRH